MSCSSRFISLVLVPMLAVLTPLPAQAQLDRVAPDDNADARCVELVVHAQARGEDFALVTIALAGNCGRALEGIAVVSMDGEIVGRVAIGTDVRAMMEVELPRREDPEGDHSALDRPPQFCVRALLRSLPAPDRAPRIPDGSRLAARSLASDASGGLERRPATTLSLHACVALAD
jgi:hypothetical protein